MHRIGRTVGVVAGWHTGTWVQSKRCVGGVQGLMCGCVVWLPDFGHVTGWAWPAGVLCCVQGRSGKTGIATTFVNSRQCSESILLDLKHLLKEAKQRVPHFLTVRHDPQHAGTTPMCHGSACCRVRGTTSNISRRDSVAAQRKTPLLDAPSRLTTPYLKPAGAARPAGGDGGPGSSQRHQGLRLLWRLGSPHRRLPQAAQREQGSGAQQEGLLWVWRVWWRDVAGWLLRVLNILDLVWHLLLEPSQHGVCAVAFLHQCSCSSLVIRLCSMLSMCRPKVQDRTALPQSLSTTKGHTLCYMELDLQLPQPARCLDEIQMSLACKCQLQTKKAGVHATSLPVPAYMCSVPVGCGMPLVTGYQHQTDSTQQIHNRQEHTHTQPDATNTHPHVCYHTPADSAHQRGT